MNQVKSIVLVFMGLMVPGLAAADSYRYLHVTIETPWMIFLVLLPVVLSPFILMAILYWRYAGRRGGEQDENKP